MPKTYTYTATFPRLDLIKMQIRVMLRRTSDISDSSLAFISNLLDKCCVKSISVYAMDEQKFCRGQLMIDIDWDEYCLQIKNGNLKVAIDQRWENNTAIEVGEAIELFNKHVEKESLVTIWRYSICNWANTPEKRQDLGIPLGDASPVKYAKGESWSTKIPELPEVRVGLTFYDNHL